MIKKNKINVFYVGLLIGFRVLLINFLLLQKFQQNFEKIQ